MAAFQSCAATAASTPSGATRVPSKAEPWPIGRDNGILGFSRDRRTYFPNDFGEIYDGRTG